MAKDNKATYEEWAQEVRSRLPQELQEHFDKITTHDAGKVVFGGHLTEKEFYRRLNNLSDQEKDLGRREKEWTEWYGVEAPKNERLIAERDALKGQLDRLKMAAGLDDKREEDPAKPPANGVPDELKRKVENLEQQLALVDQALPRLLKDFSEVNYRVVSEKWPVKPSDVLDYALNKRVDPITAFNELTADERVKREAEKVDKMVKDAEERGRREALKKASTPDNLRPSGPSIVDNLRQKSDNDPRNRVAGAVSDWLEQVNNGTASKDFL